MTDTAPPRGTILTPADIDRAFGDGSLFARSAYRLEQLDEYDSPATRAGVARFLAGEPDDPGVRAYWDQVVGDACGAGKTMRRVHIVGEPLTDYLRFEIAFYRGSVAAGEDIRVLPASRAAELDLPSFDYWLFDGERAAVMYYGERGAWLRTERVTETAFVESCRRWQDTALDAALPLSAFMAERGPE